MLAGILAFSSPLHSEPDNAAYTHVVNAWCRAINNWNLDSLRILYSDTVLYYGTELPAERCVKDKMVYMAPFDAFYLHSPVSVSVSQQTEHIYRCDFNKKYRFQGKTYTYPSYLLIFDDGFNCEIIGESDLVTDRKLAFRFEKSNFLSRTETQKARGFSTWSILLWVIGGVLSLTLFYFGLIRRRMFDLSVTTGTATELVSNELSPSSNQDRGETIPAGGRRSVHLENIASGRDFESFVVKKFLPLYFKVSEWTSDKGIDGIYPLSNSNPDLVCDFQLREFRRQFAVECKYRSNPKNPVSVARPEQLTRYKAFSIDRKMQVYIALGIGGTPHNPKELYLVPLDDCKSEMTYEELRNFSRSTKDIWFYKTDLDRLT